jgi:hypothetical protein
MTSSTMVSGTVTSVRMSMSWFVPVSAALTSRMPTRLTRSLSWRELFDHARLGEDCHLPNLPDRRIEPPWPLGEGKDARARGMARWSRYATLSDDEINPRRAWLNLLPLRLGKAAAVSSGLWKGQLHELVYPHGIACVLDLGRKQPGEPLERLCDEVPKARSGTFTASGYPPGSPRTVADTACRSLAQAIFGSSADPLPAPLTVVTILQGSDLRNDPGKSQRARFAASLAGGIRTWSTVSLDIRPERQPARVADHIGSLWAIGLGRWLDVPTLAETDDAELGPAHRDLMWMSLQADALGAFATALVETSPRAVSPTATMLRRTVSLALNRLRSGAAGVPGESIVHQLRTRGYSAAVAALASAEGTDAPR